MDRLKGQLGDMKDAASKGDISGLGKATFGSTKPTPDHEYDVITLKYNKSQKRGKGSAGELNRLIADGWEVVAQASNWGWGAYDQVATLRRKRQNPQ